MKIGLYESDITPPLGLFLPGHGRWLYANGVYDKIFSKAVAFEAGGEVAIIISIDTVNPTPEMYERVTSRIGEYTGVAKERISVHCTHTHWGAPLSGYPIFNEREDREYCDVCYRLIADSAILAYRRMEEAECSFTVGRVEGIAFNRDYVMEDGTVITYGTNGKAVREMFGPTDTSMPMVKIMRGGKVVGAIINYAMHQCCGDHDFITGDYSSILSKRLKERYGADFVSIFTAGTCGDINHLNTNHVPWDEFRYREIGNIMADAAIELIENGEFSKMEDYIRIATDSIAIPRIKLTDEYARARAKELLTNDGYYANINSSFLRMRSLVYNHAVQNKPSKPEERFILKVFNIGGVAFYMMPGEIFVKFGLRLKASSPIKRCMVLELSNSPLGYVATPEAFGESCDLYEVTPGCLIPEGGDIMVDRLLELGEGLL